jgi:hypothetical protein
MFKLFCNFEANKLKLALYYCLTRHVYDRTKLRCLPRCGVKIESADLQK